MFRCTLERLYNNLQLFTLRGKKRRRRDSSPDSSEEEEEEEGEVMWVEKRQRKEGDEAFVGPVPELTAQAVGSKME